MRMTRFGTLVCLSGILVNGCSSKGVSTQLSVRASGVSSTSSAGTSKGQSHGGKLGLLSVTNPDLSSGEYLGMGTNSGDAVVDSLKVKLTNIATQTGAPGEQNTNQQSTMLFDWSSAPRELEIKDGFNAAIEDTTTVQFAQGDYLFMSVSMLNAYDVKAYAYLDSDADGTIDTTIYTTAAQIVKVPNVISPASLHGDASFAYDYFHYGFLDMNSSESATNSTSSANFFTAFANPIRICDSSSTAGSGGADGGSQCQSPPNMRVDLLIDTTRLIKAWDGRFGDWHTGAAIPPPIMPFPNDPHPTNGKNRYNLGNVDFFPGGTPAFGFGTYLPMFSFITPDATGRSGMTSQTYSVSTRDPAGASFKYNETYRLTVVYDDHNVPQIGQAAANVPETTFFMGQGARVFEPSGDGYSFYTDGTAIDPVTGVDDGGLYYHNDRTMAGHKFTGLKQLANVGDVTTMTQIDGPRCDASAQEKIMHEQMGNPLTNYDAYNHCVTFAYNQATMANDANALATLSKDANGIVSRTLYLERLK